MIEPQNMQIRTQDFESSYHDLGQFYFFKTNEVISNNQLWTTNTGYLELADLESHDIDTEYDWEIAEFKFKHLQKKLKKRDVNKYKENLKVKDINIYRKAFVHKSYCTRKNEDFEQVMKGVMIYRGILEQDSTNVKVLLALGKMSVERSGDYGKAVGRLESAIRLAPNNLEANLLLAQTYVGLNRKSEAKKYYHQSNFMLNNSANLILWVKVSH